MPDEGAAEPIPTHESAHATGRKLNAWLRDHLVCPRDYQSLKYAGDALECAAGHTYPVVDGVPIMLVEEDEPVDSAWRLFEQAYYRSGDDASVAEGASAVDPYVQKMLTATCGRLYSPAVGNLQRYPIPRLQLPPGSGELLLDVGCNWGRWCIAAARSGYAPIGIDPSFDAIDAAYRVASQLNIEIPYVVADARNLPFLQSSFDVVFSYSVLQHFDKSQARRAITEIGRVLRPSGKSLVQMANLFGARNLYNYAKRGFRTADSFLQARYWTPHELRHTFDALVGSSRLSVDGFFSLNPQSSDKDLLPMRYRAVVRVSEALTRLSRRSVGLAYLADSLYIEATRRPD